MNPPIRFIRLPEVKSRTGLARSSLYARVATGTFPQSVSLGGRAVAWIEAEVQSWIEQQIQASRQVGQ